MAETIDGWSASIASVRPAPIDSTHAAFANWSRPKGRHSSGRPRPSAAMTVPSPAWVATSTARGRRRSCGT